MQITEYVTLGHPDKVADYISSHILDRAKQFIKKNNWNVPVFCDIACAIGRRDIEICLHDGQGTIYKRYTERKKPQDLIKKFKLDTPIYAHLCREGLFSGI